MTHGLSRFADEQPSKDIKATIESRHEEINWSVDIVLSHTCPVKYIPVEAFLPGFSQDTVDCSTEDWLIQSKIDSTIKIGIADIGISINA